MSFELTILGSNSATPVFNRHQTAQILKIDNEFILIDCGEGTQMQVSRYRFKLNKINYIFISHLHGDHYLGLVGLLSTMHLFGRTKELYLYGPPGLSEIITTQLRISETILNYTLIFKELDTEKSEIIEENKYFTVTTIPLIHRINCCGFLFKEAPKKHKVRKDLLPDNTPLLTIANLKKGLDILDDDGNMIYRNVDYTIPPAPSISYAYMSDTAYSEKYLGLVNKVDLLYHESTFLNDMQSRAKETFHTTALEAGNFARLANVRRLVIGHFSSRYKDLIPLLEEARTKFTNTFLAIEGETFHINPLDTGVEQNDSK